MVHPRFGEGLVKAAAPVAAPIVLGATASVKAAALGLLASNPVTLPVAALVGAVALGAALSHKQEQKKK